MKTFSLLKLEGVPIFEQLQLEEALLRADEKNWCIVNTGAPRAVVMGLSAKPEELVDLEKAKNVPLIKRFSGGGTVVVDEHTLFITFICQTKEFEVDPMPHAIMKWSEELYKPVFNHPHFQLRENDYVLGEYKFGGNAQYIRKGRWLHHTSFLWDYHAANMELLLMPKKQPSYRSQRGHGEFLCKLKDHFPSKEKLMSDFENHLHKNFSVQSHSYNDVKTHLEKPHRKSTHII